MNGYIKLEFIDGNIVNFGRVTRSPWFRLPGKILAHLLWAPRMGSSSNHTVESRPG